MELREATARNMGWTALSQFITVVVYQLVLLYLATRLAPQDFGVYAACTIVNALLLQLTTLGLDYAAIRSNDNWTVVISTGTLIRILLSVCGVVAVAVLSEDISTAFGLSGSGLAIFVASLTVLLSAASFPAQLDLTKRLRFRELSIARMTSAIVWCVLAIGFTNMGLASWALVLALIPSQLSGLIALYLQSPARPSAEVSTETARRLLRFGSITYIGLLTALVSVSIDKVIVGAILGSVSLGVYWAMFQYGNLAPSWLTGVINTVMFPTYVALDNRPDSLKYAYRETLRYASEFAGLLSFGIAGGSQFLVTVLLGDEWSAGVSVLSILAVGGYFTALTSPAGNVFVSRGRPELIFRISLLFLIPLVILLVISASLFGLIGVSLVILIHAATMFIYVIHRASQLLGVRTLEVSKEILPSAAAGIAAATCLLMISSMLNPSSLSLVVAIVVGTTVYCLTVTVLSRGKFAEDVKEGVRVICSRLP